MEKQTSEKLPKGSPSDHLANERTFLAWIRTSIALTGFGFVIVKFALFIRQVSAVLDNPVRIPYRGYSAIVGIVMVGLGAVIAVLAFFRYQHIYRQLNSGSFFPAAWLPVLLTLCILAGCILLVWYLLPGV